MEFQIDAENNIWSNLLHHHTEHTNKIIILHVQNLTSLDFEFAVENNNYM